uniref:NADH dehydrogenase subunit 4 n=1 Tax=Ambigolimax valentianus TaxID=1338344 RepID=UPI0024110063|nr:NADH dehydrogenase subunit 4 [Ambigolimax valentianus]WEI33083.1 NADH dehydrogenase subunit 4 [Ambigolimax valentianus]
MVTLLFTLVISILFINWEMGVLMMIFMTSLSLMNFYQIFNYVEIGFFLSENLSNLMVTLSLFLCFLSILCTSEIKNKMYLFMIFILGGALLMAFSSNNIILFYIFFEISLIPTLVLIIGWGYQPERLQAGTYMMMYTVGASLPLLVFLIMMSNMFGTFNVYVFQCINLNIDFFWFILVMLSAFLVKLPMYMYHLWLPKAHVEAPLAGSMILAGILLKLGGYGLYLMFKMFDLNILSGVLSGLVSLSLMGGFLASIMCLQQMDVKSFVAYSSVAHMSLVVAGVFLNTSWGITSMKITMFAHGFTSPALFLMAYISYLKSGSRSLMYSGGLLALYPLLSLAWFFLLSVNMAAPPTLNLIGELLIMPALWSFSGLAVLIMMLLMMFGAIYNMYLYSSINHGGVNKMALPNNQMKSSSYLGLLIHVFPLFLILNAVFFTVLVVFY